MADRPFADNPQYQQYLHMMQANIDPALRPRGKLESMGFWRDTPDDDPRRGFPGASELLPDTDDSFIRDLMKKLFMSGEMFREPEPQQPKKRTGAIGRYIDDRNGVIDNF